MCSAFITLVFPLALATGSQTAALAGFWAVTSTTLMWAGPSQHYSVGLHVARLRRSQE